MNVKTFVFNGWAARDEDWSLCTFARDRLFNYIEQLEGLPERVMEDEDAAILVGFSMGGSTALRMLLAHPDKVCGLVLISTTARMMEERKTGWVGMSLHRRAALKLGTVMTFRDNPSPLYQEAWLDRGLDYLQNTDLREPLRAFADSRFNLERRPVEIFQSMRDGIVRPANAEFLKSVFPQAFVTHVPGNEHVLPRVIPESIDAAVEEVRKQVLKEGPAI